MATATASSQAKVDVRPARWQQSTPTSMNLPRVSSGGIIPDVPLDSLVANLVARTEQANCNPMRRVMTTQTFAGSDAAQTVESARSAPAGLGRRKVQMVSSANAPSTATGSRKEEDYLWETDPNGGWLSSFP